jgi:hypothetical protein
MRADLLRAPLHRLRHQTVATDRREQQCDTRENREQRHVEIVSRRRNRSIRRPSSQSSAKLPLLVGAVECVRGGNGP